MLAVTLNVSLCSDTQFLPNIVLSLRTVQLSPISFTTPKNFLASRSIKLTGREPSPLSYGTHT